MAAAAYGRLSVENSGREDDDSLKSQMDILYRYISEQHDLELVGSYIDNGYSGTNFERPEFQRLMEDVRTGKIGCIVVKDLSRFGRNYLETGYYLETVLPRLNVRLIAVNDNYDSFRKEDHENIAVPIKNIVNAMYAKDISKKRVAASEARRKRTDVVPNGNAPYGYEIRKDRKRYETDQEAAVYIRAVFQWKRMGITMDEIARRMNLMEIPVASDYRLIKAGDDSCRRQWSYSTVKTIVNNRAYAGDTVMGKLRQSLYKSEASRRVPEDEWTVIEDTHEPLVSRLDLAELKDAAACENFYTDRFKPYNIKAREALNDQLTGMVYCKECGSRMYYHRYRNDYSVATPEELKKELRGKKNGLGRTDYYVCPPLAGKAKCGGHRISADLLKIVIMDQLEFQIRTMTDMNRMLKKARGMNNGKNPELSYRRRLTAAKRKLAAEEDQIAKLYEDFAKGVLESDDFQILKEEYSAKKVQLADDCAVLEKALNRSRVILNNLDETVKSLRDAETGSGFNEDLVKRTVEKIDVTANGDIEIRFVFSDVIAEVTDMMREADES